MELDLRALKEHLPEVLNPFAGLQPWSFSEVELIKVENKKSHLIQKTSWIE
jgi:hypothetical protein